MEKYDPLAINYKMDTLEDILSIPVPTEKFELPDDFMDSIEYVLQRKATEFKKEGDMECAIACLEKAVEIIPFSPMPYPDCFERLEKYLKLNNQWDEAEEVSLEGAKQEKNFQNEFKNKVLSDAAKLGTDLLEASYHEPASAKEAMYRGRVFSISGSDTRFPVLPEDFWETRLSACSFIWGISEPLYCDPDRIIAFSNRPFIDNRGNIEKGGFRTQKEALDARAAAIAEYNNSGRTFSPKEISVSDYLDYWLETVIHKNVDHGYSYNTYRDYESKIRLHLKPAFGIYRLSSFQYAPDKVQEWADSMKVKGFSKSMIQNTLTCLQGAMNYAILPLKYIQANPCVAVKIGKMPMDMTAKAHTEYICSAEEFNQILKRFPADNCFHLSLVVPYNTGTRIGETFAIDLSQDVDFEKHELRIHGQMQKVEKTWYIKPPKYDSYRTIKMGETLEKELKFAIQQRRINKLKYGGAYSKTYLLPDRSIAQIRADIDVPYKEILPLCVKENGALLTPDSFKYCARIIHYELNNPLFHAHCLRHTHGTILAENGVNPKTVMERLGHKDITTTLQTYTFNTDAMQQTAVDVFENAIQTQ